MLIQRKKLAGDGFKGVEVEMYKLLLLLYADDIVFFQNLQKVYKMVNFTYFKGLL